MYINADFAAQWYEKMQNKLVHRYCHHGIRSRHKCRASAGFSLVEVLVASTVFTIGLAGFSALLLTSMQGAVQARHEAIAAMAAADLATLIRLNPASIEQFLEPARYVSKICSGTAECTPPQQADFDFRLWQINLSDRVQNARGVVCRDLTPNDGEMANEQCDGSGSLVIKIFWQHSGAVQQDSPTQRRYVLKLT